METHGIIYKSTANKITRELTSYEIRLEICKALENAYANNLYITDLRKCKYNDGYITIRTLNDYLLNLVYRYEQEEQQYHKSQKKDITVKFLVDFKISDNLNKGIAVWLERIGKSLTKKRNGREYLYKGYPGMAEDFKKSQTDGSLAAIEKFAYDFIKGALDFETIAKIRNEIKKAQKKGAEDKDQTASDKAFICFENPVYEFDKYGRYTDQLNEERSNILQFAKAIINGKVIKVEYKVTHHEKNDWIVFHPHYIRRVGKKYMVYGWGYKQDKEYNARLLNLIVSRVKDIEEMDGTYKSAKELDVDYNGKFFQNVITYDAARDDVDRDVTTRVVLKVVREKRTPISGRILRPFERIQEEPLHHSQRTILMNDTIDGKYGYVELHISDYMYIKKILLPWGGDVIVESPAELRQLMQEEIARMTTAYGMDAEEKEMEQTVGTESQEDGSHNTATNPA